MKLAASIPRSLQADLQAELRDIERAVSGGTREAGHGLKTELRRQVGSAGLGQRLANSWRERHYPNQKLDAATLVYTKGPQIIRAFDDGAVIRSRRGLPSHRERAAEGNRRQADQPQHLPGAPLRTAPIRAPTNGTVAAGGGRLAGLVQPANRRAARLPARQRSSPVRGVGLTTVVMFLLVRQVKLSKRLDVARAAEHWSAQLPALIEQQLRSE